MRLKRAVQLILYSSLFLLIGALIILIALITKAKEGKFLIFEMGVAIPFILIFIFNKAFINLYLKKAKYPGVFYAVLEKLKLLKNIEPDITEEMLNEIYKPSYPTREFIADNKLNTVIRQKISKKEPLILASLGACLVYYLYYSKRLGFHNKTQVILIILAFVILPFYTWIKSRKIADDDLQEIQFTPADLIFPDIKISWPKIYDWEYKEGGRGGIQEITINYYDENNNTTEFKYLLQGFNIDKIDFLMLMCHFKGKYGPVKS